MVTKEGKVTILFIVHFVNDNYNKFEYSFAMQELHFIQVSILYIYILYFNFRG